MAIVGPGTVTVGRKVLIAPIARLPFCFVDLHFTRHLFAPYVRAFLSQHYLLAFVIVTIEANMIGAVLKKANELWLNGLRHIGQLLVEQITCQY